MEEKFKLITKRGLAWGFVGVTVLILAFIAVWGALTEQTALVTLAVGALIGPASAAMTFYFSKKTSEE